MEKLNEAVGMVIKEYIGLRSKKYSYETNNKTTKKKKKKCAGISETQRKKAITIDDYPYTLFNSLEKKTHPMKSVK